jgi:lipid-A-disaccharide synthase
MMSAGEASGDKHGAALARALRKLHPDIALFGAGGSEMRDAGVETILDSRTLGVIGVAEIARVLGRAYRGYRTLLRSAEARRPDAVVLIDWPDFNLRLAKRLRRDRFKIVYYISPQVWAWKQYRVRTIRDCVDRMLVILPFEVDFYRRHGIQAEYVGHPLAGRISVTAGREEFCLRNRLDPERPIMALLPGSRQKEVHYHLPAMLHAAKLLQCKQVYRHFQVAVPLASTIERAHVAQILRSLGGEAAIVDSDTANTLGHSLVAVVASGTATVEAALIGVPMVIVYRGSEMNYRILRPLINIDTFGMVNLIAGRRIVPELIQREVTGERIAGEVDSILSNEARFGQMKADVAAVREQIMAGGLDASENAAALVLKTAAAQVAATH